MFELGVVMYQAFNDPKELKKLDPQRHVAEQIIANMDDLPAMLRIPKKRSAEEDNNGQ